MRKKKFYIIRNGAENMYLTKTEQAPGSDIIVFTYQTDKPEKAMRFSGREQAEKIARACRGILIES